MLKLEADGSTEVELKHRVLVMTIPENSTSQQCQEVLDQWYREEVKAKVAEYVAKWEPILDVKVSKFYVQRMKTKWGSCNSEAASIRINTELAKKPVECLEYLVVHEMVHILEPTHNAHFHALMDRFMPNWQQCRQALNRLPVRHEDWRY